MTREDWELEESVPFTITGTLYFSPVVNGEVYVIDAGTNFYKYNIITNQWSRLPSPNYSAPGFTYRNLALSPNGTKLACCSDGYTAAGVFPTSGGRRIEIYNIATNTWTASSSLPTIIATIPGLARALVWIDEDTIWVWAIRQNGTASGWNGKCIKYTVSTDTFTVYTADSPWFSYLLSDSMYAYSAAISSDGNAVFMSVIGWDYYWLLYNVAADSYTQYGGAGPTVFWQSMAYAADRNRLWFTNDTTGRQGYLDANDRSLYHDIYLTNPERDTGYGIRFGVRSDLARIIAYARSSAPELMSSILSSYYLNVKGINLPYEDKDNSKELHVLLKNLSPTSKVAGAAGEVVIEVTYEPAA